MNDKITRRRLAAAALGSAAALHAASRQAPAPAIPLDLNAAAKEMRVLMEEIRKDPRKYLRVKLSVF